MGDFILFFLPFSLPVCGVGRVWGRLGFFSQG